MAKRQRPRANARGNRGSRPGARPAGGSPRGGGLSASEEARAAEIEAQIVAQEAAAQGERSRSRDRKRTEDLLRDDGAPRTRTGSLLAIRGEQEYTYVVRDVRRIATVGGSLVGVLIVLYILIEVVGVIRL
jgi:hypothetical protein